MAAVIPRPGKISAEDLESVIFDIVKSENHEMSNTITDHPVEDGVNVSDHVRNNPDKISFVAVISNTPLSQGQQSRAVRQGDFQLTTTAEDRGRIGNMDGLALAAWKKLRTMKEKGVLVTVSTTLQDYESMAIESVSAPRDSKRYDALECTITFKKIRVVKNKLTRNVQQSTDPRAQKKGKAGAQQAKPVEEKRTSTLFKGADAASSEGQNSSNETVKDMSGRIQRNLHN